MIFNILKFKERKLITTEGIKSFLSYIAMASIAVGFIIVIAVMSLSTLRLITYKSKDGVKRESPPIIIQPQVDNRYLELSEKYADLSEKYSALATASLLLNKKMCTEQNGPRYQVRPPKK